MSGLFDAELFTVGCLITDGTSHPNPDVVFSETQSPSKKVLHSVGSFNDTYFVRLLSDCCQSLLEFWQSFGKVLAEFWHSFGIVLARVLSEF